MCCNVGSSSGPPPPPPPPPPPWAKAREPGGLRRTMFLLFDGRRARPLRPCAPARRERRAAGAGGGGTDHDTNARSAHAQATRPQLVDAVRGLSKLPEARPRGGWQRD